MKILTVVGARPQFIKAAVVSHELRKHHTEILVHTGQHFDYNMSEQFFNELNIPKPDYNLGISGGSHAHMTGKMLEGIEDVLIKEKPDALLIYGDTNSTLSAALAASKLHIPIVHVEAGARTYCMTNPEEINRVCVDHISSLLLTSTLNAVENLKKEGLAERTVFVGNTMYDAFEEYSQKVDVKDIILNTLAGEKVKVPDSYYYMTCHREENTNTDENLTEILKAMNELDSVTIYPVHPRNKERVLRIEKSDNLNNIIFTEPVGYLESISLLKNCKKVVTDSGGLQTEAFFAKKKCVTILDFEVWPETMVENRNVLAKSNAADIISKLSVEQTVDDSYQPFGDGHAAKKIVNEIENYFISKEKES